MPIVNGQPADTGCYAEGWRGWTVGQRAIEIAQGYGWELDAEGQEAVDRYYDGDLAPGDDGYDDSLPEIVSGHGGIVDEATDWLNDHTEDGFTWNWRDGEFFLSPICENGDCDDDTCAHWD